MTNLDDFDRSLAAFLADGPNTAPEAPVIAAMAHARTTPRRPDPLRFLRADAMAPRGAGLGRRSGLVLAALAVALAVVGVAVVGSRQPDDSDLPIPSAVASPGPSAVASSGASAVASLGPSDGLISRQVPLTVAAGSPFTLTVLDETGELRDATSGTPGDGASVEFGRVQFGTDPTDQDGLIVTWTGGPCETGAVMSVNASTRRIVITRQNCSGDAVASDRVVRLVFAGPIVATQWAGTIGLEPATGDSPSPADPAALHVELTGQCCGTPSVDVVDRSGHLTKAVSTSPDGATAEVITAANDDPRTVRLAWPGAPCDTVHRLLISADFRLTIDRPICHGDAMLEVRVLVLTFDVDVPADQVDLRLFDGRPESGLPTWTATAPDSGGGTYALTVADPGRVLASLEAAFDPEASATGAGPTGIQLVRSSATAYRLIWRGSACASSPRLIIAPDGHQWQLLLAGCAPAPPEVLRMIDVTLAQPRAADALPIVEAIAPTP